MATNLFLTAATPRGTSQLLVSSLRRQQQRRGHRQLSHLADHDLRLRLRLRSSLVPMRSRNEPTSRQGMILGRNRLFVSASSSSSSSLSSSNTHRNLSGSSRNSVGPVHCHTKDNINNGNGSLWLHHRTFLAHEYHTTSESAISGSRNAAVAAATANNDDEGNGDGEQSSLSSSSSSPASASSMPVLLLYNRVRIMYASQTGMAKLFANQLKESILNRLDEEEEELGIGSKLLLQQDHVTLEALSSVHPTDILLGVGEASSSAAAAAEATTLNVFVVSTAGVGEPPDNGRTFYNELVKMVEEREEQVRQKKKMQGSEYRPGTTDTCTSPPPRPPRFRYCLFALGNSQAHPSNFCAFGKNLATALDRWAVASAAEASSSSAIGSVGPTDAAADAAVHPLVLGDDSGTICLEDAFDQFLHDVRDRLIFVPDLITTSTPSSSVGSSTTALPASGTSSSSSPDKEQGPTADDDSSTVSTPRGPVSKGSPPPLPAFLLKGLAKTASGVEAVRASMTSTSSTSKRYPNIIVENAAAGREFPSRTRHYDDLLDEVPDLYMEGTKRCLVRSNAKIHPTNFSSTALKEMVIDLGTSTRSSTVEPTYEAGDHLILYPSNSDVLVDAYLSLLELPPEYVGVDPRQLIIRGVVRDKDDDGGDKTKSHKKKRKVPYPHPINVSLYDTLRYCVDLSAVPSPAYTRFLLKKTSTDEKTYDYTRDVARARRTVLDLLLLQQHHPDTNPLLTTTSGSGTSGSSGDEPSSPTIPVRTKPTLTLEQLLYNLPRIKPRYYSIASSSTVHPNHVYLTYRPVKYVTTAGIVREGLATSYMSSLVASSSLACTASDSDGAHPSPMSVVPCAVRSNPTFRLPKPRPIVVGGGGTSSEEEAILFSPPLLFIAGGCGIAPIRAFLEELIRHHKLPSDDPTKVLYGPAHLFLGFRNPLDAVYKDLVAEAVELGIVQTNVTTYNTGGSVADGTSGFVSDAILNHKHLIRTLLTKHECVTFLCGGAYTFGAAIENAFERILTMDDPIMSQQLADEEQQQLEQQQQQQRSSNAMTEEEAKEFIRNLAHTGRLHEDLSD